ncbi:SUN domain-containing ossification factor-like [Ictalurus furcatus]|uniref:SUN domain-containing ossification factor-like n=1 Tax=Ictalurus furcatus TaxID=66913 RepID=UPI002350FBC4|nr:SUN domain-containing ossification factor-like [Ictalurus furcatus]
MESLESDQQALKKLPETPSVTQGRDAGPTAPLPTASLSETATPSAPESVGTTTNKEDQIVTLLPEDEVDEPDKSSSSIPQDTEKERVKAPQEQQYSGVKENLLDEASLGGHSVNIQSETSTNGQSVQPSSSDYYAEIPSSTDAPIHGSSQKESVFMRLNNRIKALEVNMSLSGRYLEQLSQRYRKQMDEMQKAFNKTIIKLQNTSRMAEEQDQKQTESIQVLQRQLENVTQLVLNLSLQVSQLQREVSDRHSYLLLCVVLGLLICIVICVNYCRMSAENLSTEPDTYVPNSYSYCCPDRKPETITPTLLSTLSVPNGGLWCNDHRPHNLDLKLPPRSFVPPPFSSRDSSSEGSSEDSSQSDEPSFCGIASCSRLCDPLPAAKSCSKKRNRLKKRSTVLKQLLQPVQCNGPPVTAKFTLHGLITGSTELNTNRPGVPLLPKKNSYN